MSFVKQANTPIKHIIYSLSFLVKHLSSCFEAETGSYLDRVQIFLPSPLPPMRHILFQRQQSSSWELSASNGKYYYTSWESANMIYGTKGIGGQKIAQVLSKGLCLSCLFSLPKQSLRESCDFLLC